MRPALARLWLAGLLATPFHTAADGAALHAVADGRFYHVASDTAATTLVARLDVGVESMTTLNGSLHAASSGDLPALYQVAADGMTDLKDHSTMVRCGALEISGGWSALATTFSLLEAKEIHYTESMLKPALSFVRGF